MPSYPPSRAARLSRLQGLYAIVGGDHPVAQAEAVVSGGAAVVQVRMKAARPAEVLEVARRIVALAAGRALVLVNDRADLALLSGADGAHVGGEDLPVPDARKLLGPDLLLGWTATTVEEARRGIDKGADHVGFGPVFVSRTKAMGPPPHGRDEIADVARAGAACAAVIEALFKEGDPRTNAAELARAFAAGRAGTPGGERRTP